MNECVVGGAANIFELTYASVPRTSTISHATPRISHAFQPSLKLRSINCVSLLLQYYLSRCSYTISLIMEESQAYCGKLVSGQKLKRSQMLCFSAKQFFSGKAFLFSFRKFKKKILTQTLYGDITHALNGLTFFQHFNLDLIL